MPMEMIAGAEEYYEYTKGLTQEEAYALDASEGSVFREMVNIETPDDYTLVYHCTTEKPILRYRLRLHLHVPAGTGPGG